MSPETGTPEEKVTVLMEGDLTIGKAGSARDELRDAMKNAQHIELNVESAKEVDLSFLQLLCSAHRTSMHLGKTMSFQGTIPATFKQSVEDNGYARLHGCALDFNNTCLWLMK